MLNTINLMNFPHARAKFWKIFINTIDVRKSCAGNEFSLNRKKRDERLSETRWDLLRGGHLRLLGLLDGQEKLELGRQLVLAVESVAKVNSADSAVGVDLNSQSLDVIRSVRAAGEVWEVELNLVPAFLEISTNLLEIFNFQSFFRTTYIKSHWHRAYERLHARRRLVVAGPEPSPYVLVIEDLNWVERKWNIRTISRTIENMHGNATEQRSNANFPRLATEGKSTKSEHGKIDFRLTSSWSVTWINFYRSPELQMWSISWGSWWSSRETEVWCPKSSSGRRDKWWKSWRRLRRLSLAPATGCHCLLSALCDHCEPSKRNFVKLEAKQTKKLASEVISLNLPSYPIFVKVSTQYCKELIRILTGKCFWTSRNTFYN